VKTLEKRIKKMEASDELVHRRIKQMESQQNRNSQNSNQPPSVDPPYKRPKRPRRKSKRNHMDQKRPLSASATDAPADRVFED
jgi:hypothetical protein